MPLQEVERALDRIEALLGKGEASAAESAARALLTTHPANVQGLVLLGHCLRLQGRTAEALELAEQALLLAPKDPPK